MAPVRCLLEDVLCDYHLMYNTDMRAIIDIISSYFLEKTEAALLIVQERSAGPTKLIGVSR